MAVEAVHVKMGNLGAQASLHLRIHLIARLHELHSQIHVVSWQTIMRSQSQCAWEKTHQMILGKKHQTRFHQVTDPSNLCRMSMLILIHNPIPQNSLGTLKAQFNLGIKHTDVPNTAGLKINSEHGMDVN